MELEGFIAFTNTELGSQDGYGSKTDLAGRSSVVFRLGSAAFFAAEEDPIQRDLAVSGCHERKAGDTHLDPAIDCFNVIRQRHEPEGQRHKDQTGKQQRSAGEKPDNDPSTDDDESDSQPNKEHANHHRRDEGILRHHLRRRSDVRLQALHGEVINVCALRTELIQASHQETQAHPEAEDQVSIHQFKADFVGMAIF